MFSYSRIYCDVSCSIYSVCFFKRKIFEISETSVYPLSFCFCIRLLEYYIFIPNNNESSVKNFPHNLNLTMPIPSCTKPLILKLFFRTMRVVLVWIVLHFESRLIFNYNFCLWNRIFWQNQSLGNYLPISQTHILKYYGDWYISRKELS
jgi:hypothetical protein